MKKIFYGLSLIILSFTFFNSCSFDPKVNHPQIELSWKAIENNHQGKSQYLSQLTFKNTGELSLHSNWELFFSFSPGGKIDLNKLPKTVLAERINGEFYRLWPGPDYKSLEKGEAMDIPIVGANWILKSNEAPDGFYFVFDKDDEHPINIS